MKSNSFLEESAGLTAEEVYAQLRAYYPKERTHYGLLKKYIIEKYEMYYYTLQITSAGEVSERSWGYLAALKELRELIDVCEAQLRTKLTMKGDS